MRRIDAAWIAASEQAWRDAALGYIATACAVAGGGGFARLAAALRRHAVLSLPLELMRPLVIPEAELLDRLLEAFADLGFEGTSIRQLCRHLGVSHNLIHTRYQSKENAWYRAVDHGF